MNEQLKPCPFCGGEASMRIRPYCSVVYAGCLNSDCKIQPTTDWYDTDEEAIEAWNRRVNDVCREIK